jgi:hypothetical protein
MLYRREYVYIRDIMGHKIIHIYGVYSFITNTKKLKYLPCFVFGSSVVCY